MQMKHVLDRVAIADQPTEDDLMAIKERGFVAVVNLRNHGEPEQPLSPAGEGEKAREIGLDYLHVGVGGAPLTREGVVAVIEFIELHSNRGDVLVHCRKGGRAAALVALREAVKREWDAEQAAARAKTELGVELEGGLRTMIENYLREHHSAS